MREDVHLSGYVLEEKVKWVLILNTQTDRNRFRHRYQERERLQGKQGGESELVRIRALGN